MAGSSDNPFKKLIREIHRRSLWQVLGIYVVASWAVLGGVGTLGDALGLPDWFPRLAFGLLVVGLPIVLATAFVQEGGPGHQFEDPEAPAAASTQTAITSRIFTWRNAVLGGVGALALWGILATGVLIGSADLPTFNSDPVGASTRVPVSRLALSTEGWDGLGTEFGRHVAIAPDGSSMVLPVGGQLALKMRGSAEITLIPETEGARDVVYSPDGQRIAYVVGSDLFRRPLAGGSAVRLTEDAEPAPNRVALAWLDDGTILYESFDPQRLLQIPEDGGEPRVVFTQGAIWASGLPDGRGALVAALNGLHAVDLRERSSELILEGVLRAWYTTTGHLVYIRADGAFFAASFDPELLEITGDPVPLFDGVRVTSNRADIRLAADGTLLYVESSAAKQLVVVDQDGDQTVLDLPPQDFDQVGWSSDGRSVVFASDDQIYTYDLTLGATPRQLTFEGVNDSPVFSPAGTRLAFSSDRDGTDDRDLFVKNLNDDSPPRSIITLEGNQWPSQWPSDTLIVFTSGRTVSTDLSMVDPSDPSPANVQAYLSGDATLGYFGVSPDGSLAAYMSNESGQSEVYVRSFPEPRGPTIVSQGGGGVPYWAPDGRTLYYTRDEGTGLTTLVAAHLSRDQVPVVVSRDSLFTISIVEPPFSGSGLHPDGNSWVFVGPADVGSGASRPDRLILVQNFFEELRQRVGEQ